MFVVAFSLVFVVSCKDGNKAAKEMVETVEDGVKTVEAETEEIVEEVEEEIGDMKATRPTVNIEPNQKVSTPLTVRVNSQGLWMAHEGEVGWATLLDESGNELATGILKAEGEWMKSGPVMYRTVLEFNDADKTKGTLLIKQNPGPGDGAEAGTSESFEIPVTF
jgi:hypothetical protein